MHNPIKLASSASQRIGRLLCREALAHLNNSLRHGWGRTVGIICSKMADPIKYGQMSSYTWSSCGLHWKREDGWLASSKR